MPYAFVFFEKKLIWSGNPGYMIGELESLLDGVAKSEVSVEELMRKKQFLDAGLKEVRHFKRKLNINTESRIKILENYYRLSRENFIAYPKSYDQVSAYIDAIHELLINLEKNKTDKVKERILELQVEIQDLSKQAMIAFNGKKDELTYIARDLIKFTKIMPLDTRDLISLSEKSIGTKGESQYPDYIYYVYSELLFLQGRVADSRKALDQALNIVDDKKYKEAFLSMYLDHDNRLKAYEKEICTGFISCIKKAVGF